MNDCDCAFQIGLSRLLTEHRSWLKNASIGLVSHRAATLPDGRTAAEALRNHRGVTLRALFGPEHGYLASAGAGAPVPTRRHPRWNIPIHSLYGDRRKPSAAILRGIDVMILDLQMLPVRCYTYLATLRMVMEACAETGIPLIVTDRPVPLPDTVDGPMPSEEMNAFVCPADLPLVFGMTPAETALWLKEQHHIRVDLSVVSMSGYCRDTRRPIEAPPWFPPSPAITRWDIASYYPATVLFEGIRDVELFRSTGSAFQMIAAPWFDAASIARAFGRYRIPGVTLHPDLYDYGSAKRMRVGDALRLHITNAKAYRPAVTAAGILAAIQSVHGQSKLWSPRRCRQGFFDQLAGTPELREALTRGDTPSTIRTEWRRRLAAFRRTRKPCLLYPQTSATPRPRS